MGEQTLHQWDTVERAWICERSIGAPSTGKPLSFASYPALYEFTNFSTASKSGKWNSPTVPQRERRTLVLVNLPQRKFIGRRSL